MLLRVGAGRKAQNQKAKSPVYLAGAWRVLISTALQPKLRFVFRSLRPPWLGRYVRVRWKLSGKGCSDVPSLTLKKNLRGCDKWYNQVKPALWYFSITPRAFLRGSEGCSYPSHGNRDLELLAFLFSGASMHSTLNVQLLLYTYF